MWHKILLPRKLLKSWERRAVQIYVAAKKANRELNFNFSVKTGGAKKDSKDLRLSMAGKAQWKNVNVEIKVELNINVHMLFNLLTYIRICTNLFAAV